MAKPSKKKQRLDGTSSKGTKKTNATLERLLDEESKDDEERRLESMLFGVPYVARGKGREKVAEGGLVFDVDEEEGRAMTNLLDSDLFYVDDALAQPPSGSDATSSHSDSDSDSRPSSPSSSSSSSQPHPSHSPSTSKSTTKKPAWTDSSTTTTTTPNTISLLSGPSRLRKLRHFADEDTITEKDYESRLRAQFERIHPEPTWAQRARKKNREEREDEDEDGDDDDKKNLFTSTNGILKAAERRKGGGVLLPSGTLSIERLRDANLPTQNTASGQVNVVTFHPSDRVPILCVGTADRRTRLYNIDGHTSPLVQTLHTPSLPLTTSTSALFHPSGSSILLSGPRPFFFTYDLQSGTTTRHERGLWGTTFTHSSIDIGVSSSNGGGGNKRSRNSNPRSSNIENVHLTSFDPTGELLSVASGKGAQVHLVDWKSGAGQVIASLKCTGGGSVSGLWWFNASSSSSIGENGILGDMGMMSSKKHLVVLTSDAEVYLWDVGQRRCVRRWKDEGGFRGAGRALAGTQFGNGSMAIGSSSGLVNVYNSTSYSTHETKNPKPIKSIGNLTTAISSLKFNHDVQLLAIASREKKDSMRLIHVPTLTSFANWPTQSTPLGNVTAVDFSSKSEYVAIGNTRGRVLLYHLREYGVGV